MSDQDLLEREENTEEQDGSSTHSAANDAETDELENLYSASPDAGSQDVDQIPFRDEGKKNGRISRARAKFKNPKLNKRIGVLVLGSTGVGLIGLILLMLFMINSLKLQNLAAHITEQNLTRLFRDNKNATEKAVAESLGKDVENQTGRSLVRNLKDQYGNLRSSTWGKLDTIRPQKVLDNLHSGGQIEYVYNEVERGFLPGKKLVLSEVRINGESVAVADEKFGRVFSNTGERIRFSQEAGAAFKRATPETFGIIRSRAYSKLLDGLGIKLRLWEKLAVGFKGKSAQEAFSLQQQQIAEKTYRGSQVEGSTVNEVKNGAEDTESKIKDTIKNTEGDEFKLGRFKQSLESTKTKITIYKDSVRTSIESTLGAQGTSNLVKAASTVSGIYKIAFPVCLIYDGSVVNNAGPIDDKSRALQSEGYQILSGSDQTKMGATVPEARGAFDNKLGNISASVPERIARGEVVDTSKVLTGPDRPQAGGNGSLSTDTESILTATVGSNVVVDNLDAVVQKICPIVTKPEVIFVDVALQVLLATLTGGTSSAAEQGAIEGVERTTSILAANAGSEFAEQIAIQGTSQVLKQVAERTLAQKVKGLIVRIGAQTAAITGITYLAKMQVLNRTSGTYVGLDGGSDYATQGAVGTELNMNEGERQVAWGRIQTPEEIEQNDKLDLAYLNQKTAEKSPFERYFAVSNPNSLATLTGSWVLGKSHNILQPGQISQFFSGIFKGLGSAFANLASKPFNGTVRAADPIDRHYGIIQWGWSAEENNLADNDPRYGILANAEYWEQSVSEQSKKDIRDKYGVCFTDSIGTLLKDGKIKRDESGTVTGGACKPANLGPNNPEGFGDLVFRYRLFNRYNNVLDNLGDIQNVGSQ